MTRIAYVNGRYLSHRDASVHVEDRGYQFADGVYEVIAFYNRTLVDEDLHLKRLRRSLGALSICADMSDAALKNMLKETINRNPFAHGSVYLQMTRGVAKRDHIFHENLKPSLVITVNRERPVNRKEVTEGTEIILRKDIRWARCDIKSIALLPNALLKTEAARLGKREAWLIDTEGYITEGSVSNAFIVSKDGTLVTRGEEHCFLPGITRHRVLSLARECGIKIALRRFSSEDVRIAAEAFITSTTSHLVPVIRADDMQIGDGKPGVVFRTLFMHYVDFIEQETGKRIWHF